MQVDLLEHKVRLYYRPLDKCLRNLVRYKALAADTALNNYLII